MRRDLAAADYPEGYEARSPDGLLYGRVCRCAEASREAAAWRAARGLVNQEHMRIFVNVPRDTPGSWLGWAGLAAHADGALTIDVPADAVVAPGAAAARR